MKVLCKFNMLERILSANIYKLKLLIGCINANCLLLLLSSNNSDIVPIIKTTNNNLRVKLLFNAYL